MYPEPYGDTEVKIDGTELEPGDYLNYKFVNALGKEVWKGSYVITILEDSKKVVLFNLSEERREEYTPDDLRGQLGDTIQKTGDKWGDKQ